MSGFTPRNSTTSIILKSSPRAISSRSQLYVKIIQNSPKPTSKFNSGTQLCLKNQQNSPKPTLKFNSRSQLFLKNQQFSATPTLKISSRSQLYLRNQQNSQKPTIKCTNIKECDTLFLSAVSQSAPIFKNFKRRRKGHHHLLVRASRRESPYEVLGVSPSSSLDDIKRAYRKLALKYHPDVNKEANAQERFMRIKHAYNTLLNSESRKKYDTGNSSTSSYWGSQRSQSRNTHEEEEFYGFGDFLRDLQEEFENWEASASSQAKPKSLWEELAEIGEEFVEFLEKELNITDTGFEENQYEPKKDDPTYTSATNGKGNGTQDVDEKGGSTIEDNIDEIEATLAKLKKDLGL